MKQRHIHIHLGPVAKKTVDAKKPCGCSGTHDAGTAHDPANGQFTTSGSAGGNAAHHVARAAHHGAEMERKGLYHPDSGHHSGAQFHHGKAAQALEGAQHGSKPNKYGIKGTPEQYHSVAEHHATEAGKEEAHIKEPAKKPAEPDSPANAEAKRRMKFVQSLRGGR